MSKAGKDKKANAKIEKKWESEIAKSGGMLIRVPDDFLEKTKKFKALHNNIIAEEKKFSEKAEDFKHANGNFWYDLKKFLDKAGIKLPPNSEMGLNEEAAKDGVFIINFVPSAPGGGRPGPMVM